MKNSFLLLLTAIIWGTAFVAQSVGMDYVEPFTFTFARSMVGGAFLIPCIWLLRKLRTVDGGKEVTVHKKYAGATKMEWIGGACCGLALCVASNFQQLGMTSTTVGKAGFITALYVVIVPILGLFFRRRVSVLIWICVVLSVIGLYLLCMTSDSLSLGYGDMMILICAFVFSIHIMTIDHFSPQCDGVVMACIQFFVCGILSGIVMLFVEQPTLFNLWLAKGPILYAGVLSSGVAYTLQIIGQKNMNPTIASLILCLESVVSALAGWVVLQQALTPREMMGCVLMFLAIVLAQQTKDSH